MKPLNILLVDGSPEYRDLVAGWLTAEPDGYEFRLFWSESLASAIFRLEQGDIGLILVELSLPDSEGIETFNALRRRAEHLPVIVVGPENSEALALQMIRQGAEDYLVKSTCKRDLFILTLRHSTARHQAVIQRTRTPECRHEAKVIGVLGGAGGAGTTTVACILAQEMRHQTGQATLLIDFDTNPGSVGFAMGIDPQFTVQDVAANTSRLDWSLWDGIVTRITGGPDILTSARAEGDPDIASLRKIVGFASRYYRWVVLDLGRLNRTSVQLLPDTNDVVLVSTQEIPVLQQCRHVIGVLCGTGLDVKHIHLVLNRIRDNDVPISRGELDNLFGIPIAAILPPAHRELSEAYLTKRRLSGVTGNFRSALTGMTRKMADLSEEEPKRAFTSLAQLAGIFRHKNVFTSTR